MPLLGFLAAGAANSYAQMKNAETDQQNKMGFAIIQAEMENSFRERLAERQHTLGVQRDQLKQSEVRKTNELKHSQNLEVKDKEHQNRLKVEQAKGGIQRSNELLRQDRQDARSKANISSREKVALLNKSSGSAGGMSVKDLTKSIESDRKEIFNLNKELANPMNANNPQTSKLLKDRIRELQSSVADKLLSLEGNAPKDDNESKEMANLFGK